MKRWVNFIAVRVIVCVMITFLIPLVMGNGSLTSAQAPVTLTIIAPWAGDELVPFKPVMEEFERRNPGIKIEYRTGRAEDVATILAGQFAVGTTPADIIDIAWSWYIVEQAKKGHIMEVSDLIDEKEHSPSAFDQVRVNGKIYGAPCPGGITVPEYRISFFEEHNLPDPKELQSWDEFVALLDEIKKIPGVTAPIGSGNGVGWPFTSVVENLIIKFGGPDLHRDLTEGNITWTSHTVRGIFAKRLLPLLRGGYFGEPDDWDAVLLAMWNGEYGIYIGDSTDSLAVEPPEDRGVFLLPGQEGVLRWGDWWFIPKYTKHPEEAKKLFKFLASEGQLIQVSAGGRISTYVYAGPEDYPPPEREVLKAIAGKEILPDMDDTIGGEFQTTIWDQLKLIWVHPDEETLDEVLETMQEAAEATLGK